MKQRKFARIFVIFYLIAMCLMLFGCKKDETQIKKVRDLEFTVVEEADLPENLLKTINEKKDKPFTFSYFIDTDYLYICVGYGAQKSGGYSITVDELYLADNAIYIDTNLLGPSKDDPVTQVVTYPYIVVKIEYIDKVVAFN
ncbi:MAG: protease complex subunit PrcB family protein [Lachnospiraceae bacterium]|nr:protease complex subunit PrcB family protein [Lachnospiraceae bacterium]